MKKNRNVKMVTILIMVLLVASIAGCSNTAGTPETETVQNEEPTTEPVETTEQMDEKEETTAEPEQEEPEEQMDDGMPTFTLEELSKYDGMNGNKAYVAYNGDVYDVTDVPQWKSGSHGGNMAGTDITQMLDAAPHGTSKLNGLVMVGKLSE